MDKIDTAIIHYLQKNARMAIKDIAKEVYLSSPAVSARIEKLEKEGIIKGYRAQVDLVKLGYYITAYVDVEMSPSLKPKFYKYIEAVPNVLECSCVTGDFTMHMKTAFHTTAELDAFITELQHYGRTSTQIVFSTNVEPRGIDYYTEEDEEDIRNAKKKD